MEFTIVRLSRIVSDETDNGDIKLLSETVADDVAGWDSVAHSRIIIRIEDEFSIAVPAERAYSFNNVGELVQFIDERTGTAKAPAEIEEAVAPLTPAPPLPGGSLPEGGRSGASEVARPDKASLIQRLLRRLANLVQSARGPADIPPTNEALPPEPTAPPLDAPAVPLEPPPAPPESTAAPEEAAPSANRPPIFNLFSMARYPAPYSMFHDRPGTRIGRAPDLYGFNNVRHAVMPKPSGERRVLVFGNSTIRGGDIVIAMNARAGELGRPEVQFYNFGMVSANCYQTLMYFIFEGINLQPDAIVTVDGHTDIGSTPVGYDPRPGYPYNQYMLEVIHEAMGVAGLSTFDFVRAERDRRIALRERVGWKTDAWEKALVDSYVDAIRKFHAIGDAFGVPVMSCLQPTLAFKEQKVGIEIKRSPRDLVAHVKRTYTDASERFHQLSTDFPGPKHRFMNLSNHFEHYPEQCFTDMVHLQKQCYIEIGRNLSDEAIKLL